jgi:Fe-S-cluster containining protein
MLEDRDYIMGAITDYEEFLQKLSDKLGRVVEFSEVFYSYEEGSKTFPHLKQWQNPEHFPAFKLDLEKKRKPCVMYNTATRSCSVYDIRPQTCRNYLCPFLKEKLNEHRD